MINRKYFASLALILSLATWLPAQAQRKSAPRKSQKSASNVQFASGQSAIGIPFEFYDNIILLEVKVNNSRPMKFIFDTAAGITVINKQRVASLKLKAGDKVTASGVGGSVEGGLIRGVSLEVPGVKVLNQMIASFPFDEFPCEAREIDGIIGYDFIKEFVVELDYIARTINLHDPQSYTYARRGEVIPLTISGRVPYVLAKITRVGRAPIEGKFEIDTGSDGTLSVNSPFVAKHKLLIDNTQSSAASGGGLGGKSEFLNVRLQSLQLGSFILKAPVASFSQDTEGAMASEETDGTIGNEVLHRFKVTIDYSRQRMMLEPGVYFAAPFEMDASGIDFTAEGEGCKTLSIESVAENSPAAEAGLRAGDILQMIDGKPAARLTSVEIEKMFMREGAEYVLTIEREKKSMEFRIKLRRLI